MSSESNACFILGALLSVGGIIAYFYEERYLYGLFVTQPYRDLGMIFIVLGVVLIIAGAALASIKKTQAEKETSARGL